MATARFPSSCTSQALPQPVNDDLAELVEFSVVGFAIPLSGTVLPYDISN
jgi:hypothetical protein